MAEQLRADLPAFVPGQNWAGNAVLAAAAAPAAEPDDGEAAPGDEIGLMIVGLEAEPAPAAAPAAAPAGPTAAAEAVIVARRVYEAAQAARVATAVGTEARATALQTEEVAQSDYMTAENLAFTAAAARGMQFPNGTVGNPIEYDVVLLEMFGWEAFPKIDDTLVQGRRKSWSYNIPLAKERDNLGQLVDADYNLDLQYKASSICSSSFQNLAARLSSLLWTNGLPDVIAQVKRCIEARTAARDSASRRGMGDQGHANAIAMLKRLLPRLEANPMHALDREQGTNYVRNQIMVRRQQFEIVPITDGRKLRDIHDRIISVDHVDRNQLLAVARNRSEDRVRRAQQAFPGFILQPGRVGRPVQGPPILGPIRALGGPAQIRPEGGRRTFRRKNGPRRRTFRRKNGRRRTQKKRTTYVRA
jgi:hypothetical protein